MKETKNPVYVCCLCKIAYYGYGNNPAPLVKDTDENLNRCCDDCNNTKVIPERIKIQKGIKKYKFEIQNCIKVIIEADNVEEAREIVMDNLDDYAEEFIESCSISDGEETK